MPTNTEERDRPIFILQLDNADEYIERIELALIEELSTETDRPFEYHDFAKRVFEAIIKKPRK